MKKEVEMFRRIWRFMGRNSDQLQFMANVVIIVSIIFTLYQLKYTAGQLKHSSEQLRLVAAQTQGTTMQEIAKTSRELFMKVLDDRSLRIILDPSTKQRDHKKSEYFTGMLIQHYNAAFSQKNLGNIPGPFWNNIVRDAKVFFSLPYVHNRWLVLRDYYKDDEDFIKFVEEDLKKEVAK
jgi:hypothetical protein